MPSKPITKKLFIGLLALALLSPLGIILPEIFKADGAWGEWSTEKVAKDKGYVPAGMKRDASRWKAPVPDYTTGKENDSLLKRSGNYIFSGLMGVGIIGLITLGAVKMMNKK
ncbi:MAG: cobalamin biosynthesis protein [Bacteroidota bacterium]|nr:cobalamin biosynthesis protein [Bacteroidota bacterium]